MKKATKKAAKKRSTKKSAAKRELISPRGNKRYIRRDAKGRIKESDDVSRSLSQDRRRKAKKKAALVRATAVTANPQGPGRGKRRVPADNPALEFLGVDLLPQGLKNQVIFPRRMKSRHFNADIRGRRSAPPHDTGAAKSSTDAALWQRA
jgi:hypothetical protein